VLTTSVSPSAVTLTMAGLRRYPSRFSTIRKEGSLTSPRATANKQLIFHSSDPVRRDKDLEVFRRMSADPELAAEVLYFTKTLETPSLMRV